MSLYHLPGSHVGYFVEVEVSNEQPEAQVRRVFASTRLLEEWVAGVRLPQGWA